MTSRFEREPSTVFLGPVELRVLWENHHGVLDDSDRQSFEERPEIPWITCIPAAHGRPAVAAAKELQKILYLSKTSFEKEQRQVELQREVAQAKQRDESRVILVKKPKNPSRMRLN